MHVALINQFYPPSRAPTGRLLNDLAGALYRRGWRVTVITSPGLYGGAAGAAEECYSDGVSVRRVGPGGRHRTGLFGKLAAFLFFYPAAARALSSIHPPPDAVVCMTTPPFCALIAERLKRNKGVPYLLWCMDLYPDALAAAGWLKPGGWIYRVLSRLARRERNGAARVISLGPDMTALIRASAPQATVGELPVWSHLSASTAAVRRAAELRSRRGWGADETVLLYSGHMGRAHDVEGFFRLADRLRRSGLRHRMVFCGTGPAAAEWRRAGGERFEWLEPVSADDLAAHLLAADVHLISQRAEWTGVVVPSKYQAACGLERPSVFCGPSGSAVAQWIGGGDTGWVFPPGDEAAMERAAGELCDPALRAAKGARAGAQFRERFSPEAGLAQLTEWIGQAAGGGAL